MHFYASQKLLNKLELMKIITLLTLFHFLNNFKSVIKSIRNSEKQEKNCNF